MEANSSFVIRCPSLFPRDPSEGSFPFFFFFFLLFCFAFLTLLVRGYVLSKSLLTQGALRTDCIASAGSLASPHRAWGAEAGTLQPYRATEWHGRKSCQALLPPASAAIRHERNTKCSSAPAPGKESLWQQDPGPLRNTGPSLEQSSQCNLKYCLALKREVVLLAVLWN